MRSSFALRAGSKLITSATSPKPEVSQLLNSMILLATAGGLGKLVHLRSISTRLSLRKVIVICRFCWYT